MEEGNFVIRKRGRPWTKNIIDANGRRKDKESSRDWKIYMAKVSTDSMIVQVYRVKNVTSKVLKKGAKCSK
jgi:hypothetical protein